MSERKYLRFLLINFFIATTLLLFGDLPNSNLPSTLAQSAQANRIESDHTAVIRIGAWTSQASSSASEGNYLYSSGTVSDALILNFEGTGVEISYVKHAGLGSFAIEIDNVVRRTVVATNDTTSFDNRAVVDYLENGQHQLKVYAVDGVIAIDAFFATLASARHAPIEAAPPATILVSPLGSTTNNPPTFTWNAVSTATWYHLVVNSPTANIVNEWYSATAVGCPSGTDQCSVTPTVIQLNGTHNWWIQTYGTTYGEWSSKGDYTQDNGMEAPVEIGTVAPSGDTSDNPPTFEWEADPWAEWYHLIIVRGSTTVDNKWYSKTQASCPDGTGTCSINIGTILQNGQHQFWIQGWNTLGYGPWNVPNGLEFNETNGIILPAVITATTPSGDTADNTPTYEWEADPWAEWYHLIVVKDSTTVINKWYNKTEAGCPTGTDTCSIIPATALARGNHTWFMQGWNILGYGLWNTLGVDFNVTVGPPQSQATLNTPSGSITTNQPTFTWGAVNEATSYRLYINGPGSLLLDLTRDDTTLGCAGGGTCTYTPTGALLTTNGTHTFWILPINQWGEGIWSSSKSFTYTAVGPIQVTLNAPTGAIDNTLPTYEWNADPNASWYQLRVETDTAMVFTQWYSRSQAGCGSGTGTCSVHPTSPYLLPGTAYIWNVQSYNGSGSEWSEAGNFNLSNVAGFIDHFTTASGNWTPTQANWTTNFGHYFTDPSAADSWSTSYYSPQTYDNFDYYARLYRTGCLWCENGVIVRGTPTPLGSQNAWRSGYGFFYDQEGFFIVYRFDPDSDPTILTPNGEQWEYTTALNQGEIYNVVRVVAIDDELSFYINGVLVWQGTDDTYSSGNVGIAMKRGDPENDPDNIGEIYADWAVLYRIIP